MKFSNILEINKNLNQIKELNKKFDFELGKKLVNDLKCTNLIVDEQNNKLTKIVTELGDFDGYEYVLSDDKYDKKLNEILNEEFEIEDFINITIDDLKTDTKFDLTTIELLTPLINI